MKKWFMGMFAMLMFLASPVLAFAQDAGVADAGVAAVDAGVAAAVEVVAPVAAVPPEGFDLFAAMIEAAKGGDWAIFVSLLLMALVWLVTKAPIVSDFIKGEAKVWTSTIAGTVLAVGTSIFTTAPDTVMEWLSAIFSGLMIGLAATGLWELIKRKVEKKPIDADGDGKLDA